MNAKAILALAFAGLFAVTAATAAPVGVTVNDVMLDTNVPGGDGWTFVGSNLTLTNAGPFTISGTNTAGAVCVVVPQGVTNAVTLSELELRTDAGEQCVFALEAGASVALFLAGDNILQSGYNRPGLEVPAGALLTITHAPDDSEGALFAYGGARGAGIGSRGLSVAGEVIINGGGVAVMGGQYGAGIGGGWGGTAGSLTVNGGEVVARGNEGAAGIGGGYKRSGGTVTIAGGAVTAWSDYFGAGIGGGQEAAGCTVNISGGTVTAAGGFGNAQVGGGAGIGGGTFGAGGTVNISGGTVKAFARDYAAGIGGGYYSTGGTVNISGGTVIAAGDTGGKDIGPGAGGTDGGANTFTGGSIRLASDTIAPAPFNDNTERVWCVTVPNLTSNAAVTVASLGTYGVNDLYADENGKLYLWLPDGDYAFTANSAGYTAAVNGAPSTAVRSPEAPVFATDGSALVFSGTTLSITIANAQKDIYYTLYATATLGGEWEFVESICAENDGDLVFGGINATVPRRFFKVVASTTQP